MIKAGDWVTNQATGETFRIIKTTADTNGKLFEAECYVTGKKGTPLHVHPVQEERFYILRGTMKATVGGKTIIAKAGETVVLKAGVPHSWKNATDGELVFRFEVDPALGIEKMFETLAAYAQDDSFIAKLPINPVLMAVVLNAYPDNFYMPFVPVQLQKLMLKLGAPVGKLLGYKADRAYVAAPQAMPKLTTRELKAV